MGSNPDMNPVTVHIHINRNNLGFEVRNTYVVCFLCHEYTQQQWLRMTHNVSIIKTIPTSERQDIEDVDPAQTITLTAADLQEMSDAIDLYYVKFQRVKSLTFFIEENAGADITAIGGLQIMGRTVATTNMNDFKKQG